MVYELKQILETVFYHKVLDTVRELEQITSKTNYSKLTNKYTESLIILGHVLTIALK